jgi:hypothetical protein
MKKTKYARTLSIIHTNTHCVAICGWNECVFVCCAIAIALVLTASGSVRVSARANRWTNARMVIIISSASRVRSIKDRDLLSQASIEATEH